VGLFFVFAVLPPRPAPMMDDPFTTSTPLRDASSDDLNVLTVLALPTTSTSQAKRTLQAHLSEIRKRSEVTGQLCRDLVKQEEEIKARLLDLEDAGDHMGSDLESKLAELEKEYIDVGRETARALLTNKIMGGGSGGGGGGASPLGGSNVGFLFSATLSMFHVEDSREISTDY
jgi:hypothetical protein